MWEQYSYFLSKLVQFLHWIMFLGVLDCFFDIPFLLSIPILLVYMLICIFIFTPLLFVYPLLTIAFPIIILIYNGFSILALSTLILSILFLIACLYHSYKGY